MIIVLEIWRRFDYIDSHGRNVMQIWADNLPMSTRDRARLDSKIDMLGKEGPNLPPELLQDTRCGHIKEIRVNGQVALRALLCRGPFVMHREFTFLLGAVEKDRRYVPQDAPERAEANRRDLRVQGKKRRVRHERFSKTCV